MSFNYNETKIVKGMLARGDKQHDIAAYFGVNGGRIAEVANGECAYPSAPSASFEKLPPPGPYIGLASLAEVRSILNEAINLISGAGDQTDENSLAVEALEDAIKHIEKF